MDKYLLSRGGQDAPASLMDLLKPKQGTDITKKECNEWKQHDTFTTSDLQSIPQQPKQNTATKGWRVIDGVKTYVTLRSTGVVMGSGAEGYKLSLGDNKKRKSTDKASAASTKKKKAVP